MAIIDTTTQTGIFKGVIDAAITRLKGTPEGKFVFDLIENQTIESTFEQLVIRTSIADTYPVPSPGEGTSYGYSSNVINLNIQELINRVLYNDFENEIGGRLTSLEEQIFHETLHVLELEYIVPITGVESYKHNDADTTDTTDTIITATNNVIGYFGTTARDITTQEVGVHISGD